MSLQIANYLRKELEMLKEGGGCWAAIAGHGTGSMVALHLGSKVKRKNPLDNPNLSEEVRNYEGELCLYLEDCGWRLQTEGEVLGSSASPNGEGDTMLAALSQIVGESVVGIELKTPSFDLHITFGNGVELFVFCYGRSVDDFDNYTVFTRSFLYTSSYDGSLRRTPRP